MAFAIARCCTFFYADGEVIRRGYLYIAQRALQITSQERSVSSRMTKRSRVHDRFRHRGVIVRSGGADPARQARRCAGRSAVARVAAGSALGAQRGPDVMHACCGTPTCESRACRQARSRTRLRSFASAARSHPDLEPARSCIRSDTAGSRLADRAYRPSRAGLRGDYAL